MIIRAIKDEDSSFVKHLAETALPGRTDCQEFFEKESVKCFVGEKEHTLIGFIAVSLLGPNAEILHIAIDESERKKGHGKALMEHTLRHCRKQGVKMVTLEMNKNDVDHRRFYEHCGFEAVATRKNYYHTGEDALLMVKRLRKER